MAPERGFDDDFHVVAGAQNNLETSCMRDPFRSVCWHTVLGTH